MTTRKIAVKMASRITALMSVMPAPGLVMPAATASWLTVSMTTTAARDGADDLGEDVADAFERRASACRGPSRPSRPG